jgi:hypothetical protein
MTSEPATNLLQLTAMNAPAITQAPNAVSQPPVRIPGSAYLAQLRGTSTTQRLTVWEERARKMGFPPSPR